MVRFGGHGAWFLVESTHLHTVKSSFHVAKPRALMAATALFVSGSIMSMLVQQYLSSNEIEGAFTRSRLWWEVVLNVQLLCAGMMWFYYAEKIEDAVGAKRRYQMVRSTFSIITVSVPIFIAAYAALNNWFEAKPDSVTLYIFAGSLIVYWAAGLFLHRQVILRRVGGRFKLHSRVGFRFFIPLYFLMTVIVCDIALQGRDWVVMTPILLSVQAATPYFLKAFSLRSD